MPGNALSPRRVQLKRNWLQFGYAIWQFTYRRRVTNEPSYSVYVVKWDSGNETNEEEGDLIFLAEVVE